MRYKCKFKPFENQIFKYAQGNCRYYLDNTTFALSFYESSISGLIADGLIEEVQESVWTDHDMIEFGRYSLNSQPSQTTIDVFNIFKKEQGL